MQSLSKTIDRKTMILLGVLGTVILCVAVATVASAQGLDAGGVRAHVAAVARAARVLGRAGG